MSHLIEGQRAVLEQRLRAAGGAPCQRAHARFEFGQRKRLSHVVVRAEVQSLDALFDAVGRGQDQHGHVAVARTQALEHIQPGKPGQADVQDQQVERLRRQRAVGVLADSTTSTA